MTSFHFARARRALPLAALLLLGAGSASAQMYKWVDAKGQVHYSDKPPPPDVKAAPLKAAPAAATGAVLPFELAEAARNHPVVLYTGAQCGACEQARTYLRSRGIPYAEKTVFTRADEARLRAAGSPGEVPLLLVGRSKSVGFETSAWAALLNDAGYPSTASLPSNYQYPQAAPAAPAPVQVAGDQAPAPARVVRQRREAVPPVPAAEPTAPPGFKF